MHAVIRSYSGSGANELFDLLEERRSEIDDLMRPIQGLVSYVLLRTADGGASVTLCQDKAGTDESLRIARQWIAANASDIGASAPVVSEGPVILSLTQQGAPAEGAAIPLGAD
jgi:hypothetical protein